MQICKTQNTPSFNASLKIKPFSYYDINIHNYIKKKPLSDEQEKLLMYKFEEVTKGIKGTLTLDLGRYNSYNYLLNRGSGFLYNNGKHQDSIPVYFEKLSSDNEFVNKLVKMLEIFKMREKNFNKIVDLENQIAKLSQSTRASSLGASEKLFKMPDWRVDLTIK